ncbi:MAG: transglycosylase SLT domain-containing protein [Nocardioidaceae bacterium]|nr:transglycosylase SLT domain-containing protein [Nocardioidaceae bacterium]
MGARVGTVVAGALVTLIVSGCGAVDDESAARESAPSGSASKSTARGPAPAKPPASSPAAEESQRSTEVSRGDGQRPAGATEDVPEAEIYLQLARRAERIANNTPLAPVPTDIDRGSNRALGYQLMVEFGFAPNQWRYLDALWTRESGWNHRAENASSGAYGIPQSLPGSKMAVVGADWRSNPETQIRWGLAYIAARYGNAEGAWAHSERVGWY